MILQHFCWWCAGFLTGWAAGRLVLYRWFDREVKTIRNDFDTWKPMTKKQFTSISKRLDEALALFEQSQTKGSSDNEGLSELGEEKP